MTHLQMPKGFQTSAQNVTFYEIVLWQNRKKKQKSSQENWYYFKDRIFFAKFEILRDDNGCDFFARFDAIFF